MPEKAAIVSEMLVGRWRARSERVAPVSEMLVGGVSVKPGRAAGVSEMLVAGESVRPGKAEKVYEMLVLVMLPSWEGENCPPLQFQMFPRDLGSLQKTAEERTWLLQLAVQYVIYVTLMSS